MIERESVAETQSHTAATPLAASKGASSWEQRILQLDGKRYSLRLEHEFWTALQTIAARREVKLNRLVAEVASRRPMDGNLSSSLRVFCLQQLRGTTRGECRGLGDDVSAVIASAPAAGLALDAGQVVIAVNDRFLLWSGHERRLLLGQKLGRLFHLPGVASVGGSWVGPPREVETLITAVAPGRGLRAIARIVPLLAARAAHFYVLWVVA